jgi:hypothetical protein
VVALKIIPDRPQAQKDQTSFPVAHKKSRMTR